MAGSASAAGGAASGGLRDDRRRRRFRRHRRLGRGQSGLSAPFPALSSRRARRALAAHPDEPHRSGAVCRMFPILGGGDAAGCAGPGRHRRQDLARQPRSRQGACGAASGLGLRHARAPGDRPGGGGAKAAASRRRSRCCSNGWPPREVSTAPWSPSTPSPAMPRSPRRSSTPAPTISSRSRPTSPACSPRSSASSTIRRARRPSARRRRQGPRPRRGAQRRRLHQGRLADRRPALSRRIPPAQHRSHRHGRGRDLREGQDARQAAASTSPRAP